MRKGHSARPSIITVQLDKTIIIVAGSHRGFCLYLLAFGFDYLLLYILLKI